MSYNSKYTGQQVEELLDQVASGGTGGEGGTITEAEILAMGFTKNEGTITEVKMNGVSKGTSGVVDLGDVVTEDVLDGYVTTDTAQTIDGVKTFSNYVDVKRNPDNDSVMHMGQNASGQGMIYIDSTTSQPMMFYNNTPNGRIQIRSLKADSMPNIELLDGQVAMTISTEDSYTGIFTSNKKGASTGLAMGTNKKGSFQIVYPETTDDMPEIASITHHGDIMLRALKSEYANENYAWLRYDPNTNTLNISAFEATTEGGYPMDLDVQINGKEVAKLEDLEGKVDKIEGKQLSSEDFTTVLKQKLEGLNNYNDAEINAAVKSLQTQLNTLVSGNANDAINSFNEIIAFLDGIKDNQDLSGIIASIEQQIASKMDKVTLANVATSGSYNDLKDKPTIPSAVTESTVSGWGFTKNTGTYSKPSTGIPKSDLASAVQTSLGKADTALQSHQDISGKQDKLVSGTNIKTINGTSILGSGNIVIEGGSGGGSSSGGSGAYAEVNHGTSDTTLTIAPNTFHVWDEVAALDLSFGDETAGVANEFLFQFTSGATPTTLTLPDSIKWANGNAPSISENKIYQISVLKGLGAVLEFDNSVSLIENKITVSVSGNQFVVTSQYPVSSDIAVSLRTVDGTVNCTINSGSSVTYVKPFGPIADPEPLISNVEPSFDSTYIYNYL